MTARLTSPRAGVPYYVYRCYDADGVLLYIGCSNRPRSRIEGHRESAWWGNRISRTRFTVFPDSEKAHEMERRAIFIERPACNVKSRWYNDDPRADWTLADYQTYRLAVVSAPGGPVGPFTSKLVGRIDAEIAERFGDTA